MALYTSKKLKCYQWLCSNIRPAYLDSPLPIFTPSTEEDWGEIIYLGSLHGVLPTLYLKLSKTEGKRSLPADFLEALEGFYELNCLFNFSLREQILNTTQILNDHHINPVWLKGAINLLSAGWEKTLRTMLDLDLWIPRIDDQLKTLKILSNDGYSIQPESIGHDYNLCQHHAPVIKSGQPARLEVHRSIVSLSCSELLSDEVALSQLNLQSFQGYTFSTPSDNAQLMQSYLQCTEQASDSMSPRNTPRLMKMLDFLERFSSLEQLNEWLRSNTALHKLPWKNKATEFASHLNHYFGCNIDLPTNDRYLRRISLGLNFPRLEFTSHIITHGFTLLRCGKLGGIHDWPGKLQRQIALMKNY